MDTVNRQYVYLVISFHGQLQETSRSPVQTAHIGAHHALLSWNAILYGPNFTMELDSPNLDCVRISVEFFTRPPLAYEDIIL